MKTLIFPLTSPSASSALLSTLTGRVLASEQTAALGSISSATCMSQFSTQQCSDVINHGSVFLMCHHAVPQAKAERAGAAAIGTDTSASTLESEFTGGLVG